MCPLSNKVHDWFFQAKVTDFIHHWLDESLDAEWYWYRYLYQVRGSIHAHGCAKFKNDPGLCTLISSAALGWAEQVTKEALAKYP